VSGAGDLRAAVAAGLVGAEASYQELLSSITEVARAIFGAKASSILLLDEEADELVFAAVAGEGEDTLLGTRFPSSTGIAGWALVTRQPLVIEDVSQDPRFSRAAAERTGYVPKGLMTVPLLHGERALGVLQVLDRPQRPGFSLQEMELLGLFAAQAAIALDLLQNARRAKATVEEGPEEIAVVAHLASALEDLGEEARPAAVALLGALKELLRAGR
jgi:GAF domain-containing protein